MAGKRSCPVKPASSVARVMDGKLRRARILVQEIYSAEQERGRDHSRGTCLSFKTHHEAMSKLRKDIEELTLQKRRARDYDPEDEEHAARKHRLFELPSGPKLLPDAFDCILARVSLHIL